MLLIVTIKEINIYILELMFPYAYVYFDIASICIKFYYFLTKW